MAPPFQGRHQHFRTYTDFLNAVPATMRHLPVFLTEVGQVQPWVNQNSGWVQFGYRFSNDFGADTVQERSGNDILDFTRVTAALTIQVDPLNAATGKLEKLVVDTARIAYWQQNGAQAQDQQPAQRGLTTSVAVPDPESCRPQLAQRLRLRLHPPWPACPRISPTGRPAYHRTAMTRTACHRQPSIMLVHP